MIDVSIIIVNYNTLKMTKECIDSVIEKTEGVSYEIILVDNASTDGSKDFFPNYRGITYIYSQENLGFGRANNKGVEIAKGRNVFFLNSDTVLRNNAVKILSDYLDEHEDVGIVGGNLFDKDGKPTHSYLMYYPSVYFELSAAFLKIPNRVRFGKSCEFNHTGKTKEVAYITGADLMMKKSLIDKYGAFNPLFFMYFEETELCYRIRNNGVSIISVPQAEIFHFQGASATRVISDVKIDSLITYFRLTSNEGYLRKVMMAWKFRMWLIITATFLLKHSRYKSHLQSYRKVCNKLENLKW